MTPDPQPWWASTPSDGALDDEDPIEAFRRARRPVEADGPAQDGTTQDGPAAGDDGHRHGAASAAWCATCPLCTLARSLETTRPDLVVHLTQAAQHLAAAARSLMEQPAPTDRGPGGSGDARTGGVQHIDLDQDDDRKRP